MHLTVGLFGSQELAGKLGKKGTTNDIAIFNHSSSNGVFTYVCPNSEKIQPLMEVLNMIVLPVIVIKEITKEMGEIIIGIDQMMFERGFIITQMSDDVSKFVKNTTLEKFEIIDEKELWPKLLELKIEKNDENLMLPIDNYFNVKGIGTVVLGVIKGGQVKLHDKLMMEPLGREVVVKGIQAQDKNVKETEPGMRVGLNLKGVATDEIKRGFIICKEIEKTKEITLSFKKSKFFKQELNPGLQVLLSVGLQVTTCNVESVGEELKLKSNSEIAYRKNQRCIVASLNNTIPRIIGSGVIV
ncbi:MAG: EF-Tu/IF-2/RF-3 family GTPase [Candidatus Aenigmatarchaeota archaeon]